MRPGRPMAFGRIGGAYLFGLPGNPVGVMVTFYRFVRGALLTMMGRSDGDLPLLRVKSETAIRKKPGRTEYQRGALGRNEDEWTVRVSFPSGNCVQMPYPCGYSGKNQKPFNSIDKSGKMRAFSCTRNIQTAPHCLSDAHVRGINSKRCSTMRKASTAPGSRS